MAETDSVEFSDRPSEVRHRREQELREIQEEDREVEKRVRERAEEAQDEEEELRESDDEDSGVDFLA